MCHNSYVVFWLSWKLFFSILQGEENKRVKKESEKGIDEIDDDKSDYERQIDVRRHENEVLKHQLGRLGKSVLKINFGSLVRL